MFLISLSMMIGLNMILHFNLKKMKFSDHIERTNLELVYVLRTRNDMNSREEADALLFDVEKFNIKKTKKDGWLNLFSTPVRDVRIGESLYDETGKYITYRTE